MIVGLRRVAFLKQIRDELGRLDAKEHEQIADGGSDSRKADHFHDGIAVQNTMLSVDSCSRVELDQERAEKTLIIISVQVVSAFGLASC